MNINEYQTLAMRTHNPELSEKDARACYALGLAGEAGEAAEYIAEYALLGTQGTHQLKLVKELGDVLWYIATVAAMYGLKMNELAPYGAKTFNEFDLLGGEHLALSPVSRYVAGLKMAGAAGTASDYAKKLLFHGHVEDLEKLRGLLTKTLRAVQQASFQFGTSLEAVAVANIEKLRARYPDGFSAAASANRKASDI